ncbi:MAG: hypothetical protein RAO92_04995 [Candidatus Euphemobacter frigidus]|nr:hypothetical protein [Candidatus Euphemobacter frigidus]MDP8275740.1 hypothetical protein [Candidatus Euphemobacter frigidus]
MRNTRVLFVCVGNSCRSQIAEGYGRIWGNGVMDVESAGTFATGTVSPVVIDIMKEDNIDISGQRSKQLTREMVGRADLVIALGGIPETLYPDLLTDKLLTWPIPDPIGQSIAINRDIRDMIKSRVTDLIIDLSNDLAQG